MCVSSLSYPASKAHARYYIVICGLSESTVFFKLSHKRHDFREIIIEYKMCVFILSNVLSEKFLILRNIHIRG